VVRLAKFIVWLSIRFVSVPVRTGGSLETVFSVRIWQGPTSPPGSPAIRRTLSTT
jgi:hypothetical protein